MEIRPTIPLTQHFQDCFNILEQQVQDKTAAIREQEEVDQEVEGALVEAEQTAAESADEQGSESNETSGSSSSEGNYEQEQSDA